MSIHGQVYFRVELHEWPRTTRHALSFLEKMQITLAPMVFSPISQADIHHEDKTVAAFALNLCNKIVAMITWNLQHLSARSKYFPKFRCLSSGKIGDEHFSNSRIVLEGLSTEPLCVNFVNTLCGQSQTDYFLWIWNQYVHKAGQLCLIKPVNFAQQNVKSAHIGPH